MKKQITKMQEDVQKAKEDLENQDSEDESEYDAPQGSPAKSQVTVKSEKKMVSPVRSPPPKNQ